MKKIKKLKLILILLVLLVLFIFTLSESSAQTSQISIKFEPEIAFLGFHFRATIEGLNYPEVIVEISGNEFPLKVSSGKAIFELDIPEWIMPGDYVFNVFVSVKHLNIGSSWKKRIMKFGVDKFLIAQKPLKIIPYKTMFLSGNGSVIGRDEAVRILSSLSGSPFVFLGQEVYNLVSLKNIMVFPNFDGVRMRFTGQVGGYLFWSTDCEDNSSYYLSIFKRCFPSSSIFQVYGFPYWVNENHAFNLFITNDMKLFVVDPSKFLGGAIVEVDQNTRLNLHFVFSN